MTLGDYRNDEMGLGNGFNINYILYLAAIFVLPLLTVNIFLGISVDELRNIIDESHDYNIMLRIQYVMRIQDTLVKFRTKFVKCPRLRRLFDRFIIWSVVYEPDKKFFPEVIRRACRRVCQLVCPCLVRKNAAKKKRRRMLTFTDMRRLNASKSVFDTNSSEIGMSGNRMEGGFITEQFDELSERIKLILDHQIKVGAQLSRLEMRMSALERKRSNGMRENSASPPQSLLTPVVLTSTPSVAKTDTSNDNGKSSSSKKSKK